MWGLDNLQGARTSRHDPALQLLFPPSLIPRAGTVQRGTDTFLPLKHSQLHAATRHLAHPRRSSTRNPEPLHLAVHDRPSNASNISSLPGGPSQSEDDIRRYFRSSPPPSPPSEAYSTALNTTQLQPPPRNPKRLVQQDLNWRPPSSIYDESIKLGQVSPPASLCEKDTQPRDMSRLPDSSEISPPSSPDIDTKPGPDPEDVSPIDDTPAMFPPKPVTTAQMKNFGQPGRQVVPSQQRLHRPSQTNTQSRTMLPSKQIKHTQHMASSIPTPRRDGRHRPESGQYHAPGRSFAPETQSRRIPPPKQRTSKPTTTWDPAGRSSPGRPGSPQFVGRQRPMSPHNVISAPQPRRVSGTASPFGQRMESLGTIRSESIETRPPWNGAGGPQIRMQPIRDNVHVPPLNVPLKNRRLSATGAQSSPGNRIPFISKTGHDAASTVKSFLPGGSRRNTEQATSMSPPEPVSSSFPDHYPTPVPAYQSSPAQSPEPIGQKDVANSPPQYSPSPMPTRDPDAPMVIRRKPPPSTQATSPPEAPPNPLAAHPPGLEHGGQRESSDADPMSSPSPDPVEPDDSWVPPPSRFSITTYATSKAESPRASFDEDAPPVPAISETYSSVMNRSRPVRDLEEPNASADEPIMVSMKSPYTPVRKKVERERPKLSVSRDDRSSPMQVRTINTTVQVPQSKSKEKSTEKALPPAPPEIMSANDRVANLDARIRGLAHRRDNVNKSITQMTELMPQDNLLASDEVLKKREQEKKKVEILRKELAVIQQEEYELGIKLHRARKRIDREAGFEPATLWVRRVTS